ncbi:MAG: FimB/Mfa2 family fimbrial subunit [Tannerellaceae bacterium]|nr:FimB/Mfa2 family fimbrial subunit [Tannerellaceae bacterium]
MNKKLSIPALYILLAIGMLACIKEDLDNCLPTTGEQRYILFETKNTKTTFREAFNNLDLYIYDKEDKLVESPISYTRSELAASEYRAYLPDWVEPDYTVVAVMNDNESFEVEDTGSLHTFKTSIITDNSNWLNTQITDIYLGNLKIPAGPTKAIEAGTVYLSKLTNKFYITVRLNGFTLPATRAINVHIQGCNGKYNSSLEGIAEHLTVYMPHTDNQPKESVYEFLIDTLRLWFGDDLTLVIKLDEEGQETREVDRIGIVAFLAEVTDMNGNYLYDSDEKLDLEDEYYIEIVLDAELKISQIIVNGWFEVGQDIDLDDDAGIGL